jgi:RNA polymerase sigma-70 factor (ECF subfamily)
MGIVMYAIADSVRGLALARSRAGWEPVLSNNKTSDLALIKAVAGGDRGAMHTLYTRHIAKVYRFILRLINDPSLAEDLVSEVFLDVWRQAAAFKAKSQVSTWLLAIARNKAISTMRRRRDEQLDEEALATVEDPAHNPHALMECGTRAAIVRKCLARLSPAHREVLDLVYYHEKSIDEIAEITGIPASTVKTRAFYARSHMQKFLKSAGVTAA